MPNIIDRFLNSMKLYDDDDEDDYDDYEEEAEEEPAPRRGFSRRSAPEPEPEPTTTRASSSRRRAPAESTEKEKEKEKPARSSARQRSSSPNNVVPMKNRGPMEVCMVKPTTLEDAREVCDILLSGRAVVINMEGVHVDLAQRIIDFTSGSCFSIDGNLQKISKYIFIVSPQSISLSGDFQDTLEGSQDLSTLSLNY